MSFLYLTIDFGHQRNLPALFFIVGLVNAKSISPKKPRSDFLLQTPREIDYVLRRMQDLAPNCDGFGLLRITPDIGKSLVLWVLIQ